MHAKTCSITVAALALSAALLHAHDSSSLEVGTTVILTMAGELAEKYSEQLGTLPKGTPPPPGLQIETVARVAQKLTDGQFRLESLATRKGSPHPSLVTLTATVKKDAVKKTVTPAGTLTFSSPNDKKPIASKKPRTVFRIQLSGLEGVAVRTWRLHNEIRESRKASETASSSR